MVKNSAVLLRNLIQSNYWALLILFLYIYNVNFIFLPGAFKTRLILGIIGLFYYLNKQIISQTVCFIIISYTLAIVYAIWIAMLNQQFDLWFIQYMILNVFYLVSAFYVVEMLVKRMNITLLQLLYLIVTVIVLHNSFSFLGLLFSPIQDFIVAIQKVSDNELILDMMEGRTRSVGIGDGNFFHGGVISGIGIILTFFLYRENYIKKKICIIYFMLLLITGVFIARTTLIGLISILFIFLGNKTKRRRCLKVFLSGFFFVSLSIGAIIFYGSDYLNINWAFEIILSYINSGSAETGSTNHLQTMYMLPSTLKTFLIGDGFLYYEDGTYYMHTDVGYLRLLFYWGTFGIIICFLLQFILYYIIYKHSNRNREVKYLIIIILLYAIILNLKGFIELNFLSFLILSYLVINRSQSVFFELK